MSIQPVSFNAMSYNYPVARCNSQPIQNPAFRGIEEEQQPKKKSHTGWWVAAGLAVAGIATYLLTRGKAKGAVEKVVKNAENTVNKAAKGTSTAEKTAEGAVEKVVKETPDEIMKRYNDAAHNAREKELIEVFTDPKNADAVHKINTLNKDLRIEELKSEHERLTKQKAGIEDLINNALKKGKVANIDEEINQCEEVISRFKKESKNFQKKEKNASAYDKAKRQIAELQARKVQIFQDYNIRQYASLKKQNAEKIEKLNNELESLKLQNNKTKKTSSKRMYEENGDFTR